MKTKQDNVLQLLDQLILIAQSRDAVATKGKVVSGEGFDVYNLKIVKETLLEIFNENKPLNTNMSFYGPDETRVAWHFYKKW